MPTVVPITSNGSTTDAAQFEVGQTAYNPGDQAGGGIQQSIALPTGNLTLSADVSFYDAGTFANSYAGEAILLIDNVAVASYTAGAINPGQLLTASLSYSFVGTGQQATVGIEFVRPASSISGFTPYQDVYNFQLVDPPFDLNSTPEPGAWMLTGMGMCLVAYCLRKRRTAELR